MKKPIGVRPFLDTNVLIYAFAEGDPRKDTARRLLAEGGTTGVQNLNEFVGVARRKLGMSWPQVSAALNAIQTLCSSTVAVTIETHQTAVRIAERHGYGIFDALVVAAALQNGSTFLYSEDMQDGQVIDGLRIRNPFGHR